MGGLGPILSGSRYRPVAGSCEEYNEFLSSIKYGEYSLLSGKLLASEEDLCCIELVWILICSEINDKHQKA
jgi:hypothetical protein